MARSDLYLAETAEAATDNATVAAARALPDIRKGIIDLACMELQFKCGNDA